MFNWIAHRWRWLVVIGVFVSSLLIGIPKPGLYDNKPVSQAVYDRHQQLLRLTLSSDEKYRLRVALKDIAPVLQKATLLYEDRYFYQHYGTNPVALLKAAWTTYVTGSARVGASTISMQLARLRFGLHTQSIIGKLVQIVRALQLEWHYSKDQILEAYLNLAPYGGNIEGIAAASLIYFNKNADKLSLHEALTLAVIPQSPVYRSLDRGSNNPGLIRARDELIERWLEAYPETHQQAARFKLPLQARSRKQMPFYAPHFVNAYLGTTSQQENYSSLDLGLQQLVERTIHQYVEARQSDGIYNATALLVDYRDMSIRAMVGSADFFNTDIHGQVNGALALRSPGSTLKPFIYALGLEQGLIHTQSMLKDAPSSFGAYNPENYDRDFSGPVSVTQALVKSRNIPAVSLTSKLQSPDLYDFLTLADVDLPESRQHYGLSLVLGGAEVSMQSLVKLYAMLANKGQLRSLQWSMDAHEPERRQLLSEQASYLSLKMLGENPRPNQSLHKAWLKSSMPVYWKTGTSYGYRDAWSVGVFGPYVLAIWVGNFQGDGNPALVGRRAAAPIFFRVVDAIRAQSPVIQQVKIYAPDSVKQVKVCHLSGDIANDHCLIKQSAGFIPGVSPIKKCIIHRKIHIDKFSGLRACKEGPNTQSQVYEFWPSDLLAVFRDAGIARKLPPPYLPECEQQSYTASGLKPVINSPLKKVSYIIRANQQHDQTIAFSATTDADVRRLYWFVNESYAGQVLAEKPLYWLSRPGKFMVRVIDDHGRSDSRELNVAVGK